MSVVLDGALQHLQPGELKRGPATIVLRSARPRGGDCGGGIEASVDELDDEGGDFLELAGVVQTPELS